MIISMTGFGSIIVDLPHKDVGQVFASFELKSFNSRFFENSCRLPSSFSYLEHNITSYLKKILVRGKVYLHVQLLGEESFLGQVTPSLRTAKAYVLAAQEIQKVCNLEGSFSIADILSLPNIFMFEKGTVTKDQEEAFFKGLEKVLEIFNKSRIAEGESIFNDLTGIFDNCSKKIAAVEQLALHMLDERKVLLEDALVKAQNGDEKAKAGLEELYKSLDKIDIHEEVSRFKNHLATVHQVIADPKMSDKGRRLDFIVQELSREINTVAAKCSSFQIGTLAVDVKVDLEKAREQVQNVV